ncbi:MAG: VOC family protein [Flavobacteriales bacterium]|nr:MAG: VOC family protein [Flavobacteriales bacterium]
MNVTTNSINWFEIPTVDIKRARAFYEKVFGISMHETEMMGMKMAFFPYQPGSGKAAGSLVQGPMHKVHQDGCVIYLNGDPDLSAALEKVETAGGRIVMPKTSLGDFGNMAFFIDTEGNKVGLHSQK